ncbi:hypothetical protein KFZ70_06845 [Tamlana fucoidanivorans]|uniref:Uncharacterized protein n=1 Tax=Allotamlana fucoidanivorans TaxID=2583814 RepID=A0A5C4SP61_9FLAO|nr:hypothetical protein [Tamlana fucoidanivorans]TNJ45272.1 hypothetical protein FGF67_06060 [Tamlana fucoidanivorans]
MKTLKLLFVLGSLTYSLMTCQDNQDLITEDHLTEMNSKTSKHVEVPFKSKLHTAQAEDALTVICSATSPTDFWGLEHQVGDGSATHVGEFTIDLKFCFHVVLNQNGMPDFEGGFGEYSGDNEPIPLQSANGDLLYISATSDGKLIPIQHEHYIFEFFDKWVITGGTGRFENAYGEFTWHGLVRNDDTGTDHTWEGTIIFNK